MIIHLVYVRPDGSTAGSLRPCVSECCSACLSLLQDGTCMLHFSKITMTEGAFIEKNFEDFITIPG